MLSNKECCIKPSGLLFWSGRVLFAVDCVVCDVTAWPTSRDSVLSVVYRFAPCIVYQSHGGKAPSASSALFQLTIVKTLERIMNQLWRQITVKMWERKAGWCAHVNQTSASKCPSLAGVMLKIRLRLTFLERAKTHARRTFTRGCLISARASTGFALSNFDSDLLQYERLIT